MDEPKVQEFRVRVVGINPGIHPNGGKVRQYILGLFDEEGAQLVHTEDGVEIPVVFPAFQIVIGSVIQTPTNKSNIILH